MKFFILCFIIFAAMPVFGAQLNFVSPVQEIFIGQQFQVDLILNTESEAINAIEGKIVFPEALLELEEIKDGNSIINFWIDPVRSLASNGVERLGTIIFSGIIPGGYQETKGFLFSIIFRAKASGSGAIEIRDAKVLLNDGKGTSANLSISNFQFSISKQFPIPQITTPKIEDFNPPEWFRPEIAQDPNMFDGKYFLVFATQDKGSGIDHYEVCEGSKTKCMIAESPYVLKDQNLRSYVYVKAIDKAGNERIVMLPAKYPLKWYEQPLGWGIIILGIIFIYFVIRILWRRYKKFP